MAIQRNRCYVCEKGVAYGNNVSHANNRTRRTWRPNLQTARIVIEGKITRIRVCTRCVRLMIEARRGSADGAPFFLASC